MSLVGNLEELGLGEILQIVSLSKMTGVLSLHSQGREGSIFFRQGQVVRAASSLFQQGLGEVLIQKGVIDPATLHKALAQQEEQGFRERLGTILIKQFGIAYESIEEVVREQIERVVLTLFSWSEGKFEFVASDQLERVEGTRLDPLQFMLHQGLNSQLLAMEGSRLLDESSAAANSEFPPENDALRGGAGFDNNQSAADVRRPGSPENQPQPKMPLIIVDDDVPTLKALVEGMRQAGYDVHGMSRSEDTLIKVDDLRRVNQLPTILIDLIMPKMDGSGVLGGLELLELIHNNFQDNRIILMSDYHHADAEKRVQQLGYSFIIKPRRAELGNGAILQGFLGTLHDEICRLEESPSRKNDR